jgi:hypothetical protein
MDQHTKHTDPLDEEHERLSKEREAREEAHDRKRKEHEVEEMRLESRFTSETAGDRGSTFEIVNDVGREGPIVVKLTEAVTHKRFMTSMPKGDELPTPEAQTHYVASALLYPDKDVALAIFRRRPQLLTRCVSAVISLHGAKDRDTKGKF